MVDVPSANDAAEKFGRRGSQASQDYQQGVQNTSSQEQQQGALDGATNWESGVQDAIANNSYQRGVQNPDADWQSRALELGTQRFGPGIQASTDKYSSAVQPFFDGLEQLSLEPRGARGSQQNFQRSQRVGQRLHEIRSQR